jgi:hypothetical protein
MSRGGTGMRPFRALARAKSITASAAAAGVRVRSCSFFIVSLTKGSRSAGALPCANVLPGMRGMRGAWCGRCRVVIEVWMCDECGMRVVPVRVLSRQAPGIWPSPPSYPMHAAYITYLARRLGLGPRTQVGASCRASAAASACVVEPPRAPQAPDDGQDDGPLPHGCGCGGRAAQQHDPDMVAMAQAPSSGQ